MFTPSSEPYKRESLKLVVKYYSTIVLGTLVSLCTGILGIETSLSGGVLPSREHNRLLVNDFSGFSDKLSLKIPNFQHVIPLSGNCLKCAAKPT